jgi:Ni,Fe-hydrogenase III component G
MTRLELLTRALTEELADRVADMHVVRDNELHCSIHRPAVPALARCLRHGFSAELVFMAAADRRADRRAFEVHYLFAPQRESWFLHASAVVPADTPAISSLATFHYPASRFEREIHDLFGITAEGHPDPRPLVRHGFWPADYFPLRKDAGPREFDSPEACQQPARSPSGTPGPARRGARAPGSRGTVRQVFGTVAIHRGGLLP